MTKNALKNLQPDALEAVAMRFRALGEPSRLLILQVLQVGEVNVTDLVKMTGLSQPNVSRHLSVLVNAGLVGRRKDGLNVLYRVVDENLTEICSIVCRSVSDKSK
ncbi:MAG: metalloregulator ArsR/SmtB family transcription factor [Oligoflexia bacterium]|nr:metalloregulator ArsR/SmtB family transcription factor [Oligoflexia bacterium]